MRRRNHVLSSAEDRFVTKQAPRFVGPAQIVQVYSPVVYLVEALDSKRRTQVFVNDLEKYAPPRTTEAVHAQATAQNSTVVDDEFVGRGVGARAGHWKDSGLSTAPPAIPGAPSRPRTRPRTSAPPPTTAGASSNVLPSRRMGRPPPSSLTFRGGFEVPSISTGPTPSRVVLRDNPPMVVRYGFPEEQTVRTRTPSPPPRLQQIGRGRGHPFQLPLLPQLAPLQPVAEAEDGRGRPNSRSCNEDRPLPRLSEPESAEDVGPDPLQEWLVEEERPPRISTRPTREAGYARPGCWNCGEFGHSRIDCTLPRQRICYMCGRPGPTIATCPTCCQQWGQRRCAEMQREQQ